MRYNERRLSLREATQALRNGRIILLRDSLFEPYGVLCQAAQHAHKDFMAMAAQSAQDHLSIVLAGERMEALHISSIPLDHEASSGTHFQNIITVQVKEHANFNTHSSIDKRLRTIAALVDPRTRAEDIEYPGELIVQRAHPGGTLQRPAYNEAAVDLMRIAGMEPGALLYRLSSIEEAAQEQMRPLLSTDLLARTLSVDAIARYRREHRVSSISQTQLPTPEALFQVHHYQEIATSQPYLALTLGDLHTPQSQPPLLRLHSACMTGDIFGSQRCDCQAQLHAAMHAIAEEGRGMLLYLPQEGRGIGLAAKLQAYVLQEQGYDTIEANERLGYPADTRTFSSAIEILHMMGLRHVRLMTNNPQKIEALEEGGIVVERVALEIEPTASNAFYLQTKQERFGHLFS